MLMRSILKSLPQRFQKPSENSGGCFHLFEYIAFIFGKLAEFFIYKRSLVITEAVCAKFLKASELHAN